MAKAPAAKTLFNIIKEAGEFTVEIPIQLEELPASSCGYRAKPQGSKKAGLDSKVHTMEYYTSLGYRVLKNDGS